MKKKKIILASSSRFRASLMETLNVDFTCISPNIDESRLPNEKPKDMALRLSEQKAIKISNENNDCIVIGSDACASCDDTILGKPLKRDVAIKYLEYISNKKIIFHTGLYVINSSTKEYKAGIAEYVIKIKKLRKKDIYNYVDTHKPFHSSAGFRYEVAKDILIQELTDNENDISGLIGLPLKKLTFFLQHFNAI